MEIDALGWVASLLNDRLEVFTPRQVGNSTLAVDIESRLIVGQHVTQAANDKQQFEPTLVALNPVIEQIDNVPVDSGSYSQSAIEAMESHNDC